MRDSNKKGCCCNEKISSYSWLDLADRKKIAAFLKDFQKLADFKDEAVKFCRCIAVQEIEGRHWFK